MNCSQRNREISHAFSWYQRFAPAQAPIAESTFHSLSNTTTGSGLPQPANAVTNARETVPNRFMRWNREGRRFCAACGARLAAACPVCGVANEPGEKFCGECGASLTEVRRSSAPLTANKLTADSRSSRAVPPKHRARKILETKAALEGEREQVTVLAAIAMACHAAAVPAAEQYSPNVGASAPKKRLWGDSHLHTGWSADAGALGATLTPASPARARRQRLPAASMIASGVQSASLPLKLNRHGTLLSLSRPSTR